MLPIEPAATSPKCNLYFSINTQTSIGNRQVGTDLCIAARGIIGLRNGKCNVAGKKKWRGIFGRSVCAGVVRTNYVLLALKDLLWNFFQSRFSPSHLPAGQSPACVRLEDRNDLGD